MNWSYDFINPANPKHTNKFLKIRNGPDEIWTRDLTISSWWYQFRIDTQTCAPPG